MPTTIKLKNSVTTTNAPTSLAQGEVAINVTDKKVWVGNAATTPVLLLGSGADGTFTNLTVSGVASFADGTVSLPSITNIGDTNTGIFFPAADTIAFTEGGTESMRISSAGNLGIGQTSPSYRLDINKGSAGIIANFTDGVAQTLRILTDASTASIDSVSGTNLGFQVGSVEYMRIGSTGNVGIGTSSPAVRLDVNGSIAIPNSTQAYQIKDTGGTQRYVMYYSSGVSPASGNDLFVGNTLNNAVVMFTNNTERMRIDSAGNVGIGTSSPNTRVQSTVGSNGSGVVNALRLQNVGTTAGDGAKIVFTAGTSTDGAGIASTGVALDSADLRFYSGGNTERMRIDSSGNLLVNSTSTVGDGRVGVTWSAASQIGIGFKNTFNGNFDVMRFFNYNNVQQGYINCNNSGSTTYNSGSDYRLKDNVKPMVDSLNKVMKLKPVTFTWKGDNSEGQGFIAHELQAIVPDAVNGEKDAVTEDGTIKPQGVDYGKLTAVLTAAIQEQQALIENLTTRLNALEGK